MVDRNEMSKYSLKNIHMLDSCLLGTGKTASRLHLYEFGTLTKKDKRMKDEHIFNKQILINKNKFSNVLEELIKKSNSLNTECPICYEKMTKINNIWLISECNHSFCKKCINEYMANCKYYKNISCPLCRGSFKNNKYNIENTYSQTDGINISFRSQLIALGQAMIERQIRERHIYSETDLSSIMFGRNFENEQIITNNEGQIVNDENVEQLITQHNIREEDIQIVMQQSGMSKNSSVGAIIRNDGDVINAIIDLTM